MLQQTGVGVKKGVQGLDVGVVVRPGRKAVMLDSAATSVNELQRRMRRYLNSPVEG